MNSCVEIDNTIWQSLVQRARAARLPHALLFVGHDDAGQKQLADAFAHYLLCQTPDTLTPCGHCRACKLIQATTHPDIMRIEPEESGQMIKVDQIRQVVDFVNETSVLGGYRIIIINPASAMNINAANALLKSLEEPSSNTLFILISNESLRLPPTILSRCQRIRFTKPTRNQIDETNDARKEFYQAFIQLSQQQADPLQLAAQWQDKQFDTLLKLLLSWLRDLLCCKLTSRDDVMVNIDFSAEINTLASKISQVDLLCYIDHVQQSYARVLKSINVNRQLFVEELLIRWVQLCS